MRTRWIAGAALMKAGDVETNPGPTTSHKRVWICDFYYKQIHVRKHISIIGLNTGCTSDAQVSTKNNTQIPDLPSTQITQTYISHRHNTTTPYSPGPRPLPTPHIHHTHHRNLNTDVQHSPCSDRIGKSKPNSHPLSPHLHPRRTEPNTYTSHILHRLFTSHVPHSSKHVGCARHNT